MALSFLLNDNFIAQYAGKQPEWGPVGYVAYKKTYARSLDTVYYRHQQLGKIYGLESSEEFWLTLVRVTEGSFSILQDHCRSLSLPWDRNRAQSMAQTMFKLMWTFRFLPPGRGLWMMGAPAVAKIGGAALMNCAFVSTKDIATDFAAPFCFLADMSMLGVGVGADTKGARTVKLSTPKTTDTPFVVEDTREGWVQLIWTVLSSFVGLAELPVNRDYSKVRPKGAPIMTFGGIASGPEPLEQLVVDIIELLNNRILKSEGLIETSDITDIFNMIGRCIASGNVRRSAEIMLGEPTDEGFITLKDRELNPIAVDGWRWTSNNSILAQVGQSYARAAKQTLKNGEPGFFWLENARNYSRMGHPPDYKDKHASGTNPCSEQTLFDRELCNLVETFPAHCENLTEYKSALKLAYLYAKIVTLVPTHDAKTNVVTLKNRRIGCSMSGIVQAIRKFGRSKFFKMCDQSYQYIQELDEEYSNWLCIPRSLKTTSVKPSGTVSLLPGATPGIHFPIAEYYWRVIRFPDNSQILARLQAAGYPSFNLNDLGEPQTVAVYFPVKEKSFDRCERDVSMWEQLELAAALQEHWADNQVSCTIKFDRDREGRDIERSLEIFETRLKGISFLPHENHGYNHAPYQPISKEEYELAIANIRVLDLSDQSLESPDKFCDGDRCIIPMANNV